jgi:predicted small metal-binding protein
MNNLLREFHDHPDSVGETYPEHWRSAMGFAARMLAAAFACAVHGFIPGLFKTTASTSVAELHERMITHRHSAHRLTRLQPTQS